MERADVLIVGGGIIGTSVAWSLASRGVGGITVVDLDLTGVYASSELNAGGARATWWQPVNIESCRATLDFFGQHAAGIFAAPIVVADEIRSTHGAHLVGRTDDVREEFYAITVERRIRHPAVAAIAEAARSGVLSR